MNTNDYMNQYMKLRYTKRREYILSKLGNKCVSCSSEENLEIDHINHLEKTFDISSMSSIAKAKLEQELLKC